jgi:cytochrome c oxidase cbb3-type subunit 4
VDINTLRGLSTLLLLVAFMGLVFWAYSSKRKKGFDEAAQLPFADESPQRSGSVGRSSKEDTPDE